jgi:hypothetical protein
LALGVDTGVVFLTKGGATCFPTASGFLLPSLSLSPCSDVSDVLVRPGTRGSFTAVAALRAANRAPAGARTVVATLASTTPPSLAKTLLSALAPLGGLRSDESTDPRNRPAAYSDEKVANREIRIWHLVMENGY